MAGGYHAVKRPNRESQQHGSPYTYPAPSRGWVDSDNPANNKPGGAAVLDNLLPTQTGCRLRGGSQAVATVNAAITAMIPYDKGTDRKLFAATATGIYDATQLDGSPAPLAYGGVTGGDWSYVQFRTVEETYLYAVNGKDAPALFDGTSWQLVNAASSPISMTGGGGPYSTVWTFKGRLFFAAGMRVYYLPTGALGGAMEDLSLSGVFQKGGSIAFGASWSSDSGSGLGDRCVIVSDQGEIAIYEGSDPSAADSWSLVGKYQTAPVLGRKAFVQVGGDLLIATVDGLVPLSGIIGKDPIALSSIAISRSIRRAWLKAAGSKATGWEITRWPNAGVFLISNHGQPLWGVYGETGAWFRITGWDAQHAAVHNGRLYFGGADGIIRQGDTTGQDDGNPVVARCRWLPEAAPRGGLKVAQMARASFRATQGINFGLRFVSSEREEFPPPPLPFPPAPGSGLWDVGLWDQMLWDSAELDTRLVSSGWRSVSKVADRLAPEIQIVSDDLIPAVCELLSVDAIIEAGGVVT